MQVKKWLSFQLKYVPETTTMQAVSDCKWGRVVKTRFVDPKTIKCDIINLGQSQDNHVFTASRQPVEALNYAHGRGVLLRGAG
jgi:hypothetical protein